MKNTQVKRFWGCPYFLLGRIVVFFVIFGGFCIETGYAVTPNMACSAGVPVAPNGATTATTNGGVIPNGKLLIEPTQLDIRVFDVSDTDSFSVVNQTTEEISSIYFSSLGLQDGKTNRKIPAWSWGPIELNPTLKPNERTDCTFAIPSSDHAGVFSGSLRVNGGSYELSVPLTIRTRGPYLPQWNKWPLIFLTCIFLLGWGLSLALDRWFTTDLPRVQQVTLLRESQTSLSRFLSNIASWGKKHSVTLTKTDIPAAFAKSELDSLLVNANTKSFAELQQAAQRFALVCALDDELYTALQITETEIPTGNVAQVALQLEAVSRGQDPAAYRDGLMQVLTGPLSSTPAPPSGVISFTAGIDLSKASAASLHRRTVLMDYGKLAVTGIVVWIMAYTVYYWPNASFGTALDYLTLFLWSLGLTATGSQLVSGIRKP
jgi:hypothetical protein